MWHPRSTGKASARSRSRTAETAHDRIARAARVWIAERLEGRLLLSGTDPLASANQLAAPIPAQVVVKPAITANGVWTGAGDGQSWSDFRNWSNNVLPSASDDVIISAAGNITVFHTGGTDSVKSITTTTPLLLSGGTLDVAAASTISDFVQTGGILGGAGNVTIHTAFNWSGGNESGAGVTHIPSDVTATFSGNETLDGRRMDVDGGAIEVTGSALTMGNGAVLNLNDAIFEFDNDANLSYFGGTRPTLNADATSLFRKFAGTGTSQVGVDVNAAGTVFANTGTLLFSGNAVDVRGEVTVQPAAALNIGTDATTFEPTSVLENNGLLRFTGGNTTVGGTFVDLGTVQVEGGTVAFNSPVSMPVLTQTGGVLAGTGSVTVTIDFDWSGGSERGSGVTHIGPNVTASFTASETLDGRRMDVDGGAIQVTGSALSMGNGAVLNLKEAFFEFDSDSSLFYFGGARPTVNVDPGSLFRKFAGTGVSTVGADLNAAGAVFVNTGTLQLSGVTADLAGPVTIQTGTTLNIATDGTTFESTSSLTNSGTVRFNGGTTTLGGDVTTTGTTRLEGGTLVDNVPGGLTLPALTFLNGVLSGNSDLTVPGTLDWTDGRMDGPGVTHVPLNANLNLLNNPALSARTLDLKGTATLTGSALQMGNGAIVNLAPSGLFNIKGDGSITYFGGTVPVFNDNGTLEKSAGTGTTSISPNFNVSSSAVVFLFKGTLQLVGDTDVLGGGFTVDPGTTLIVNTNSTTVGGVGIDSGGTVRFVAGTTTLNAPFDQTGTTRLEGGTLVNNVPGGLTLPALTFLNGVLSGNSDLTVPGTLDWTDGRMDGPGVTHVPLNANLNLLNNPALSARTLDLKGTATLTGSALQMGNGAIVNLAPSGLFNIKGDGSITYFGGTVPVFNDNGTLEKSAGTGTTSISPNFNVSSSAVVFLFKGTLQLVGDTDVLGGGFTVDPGTTLIVNTNSTTVGGVGIDSGGTVRFVAGTTTLNAPFDQTGTTRLEGGTLVNNVPGGLTLPALTFVNGVLSGNSDLTVNGALDWTDGRMDGPGVTHVPLNANLNLLNNPALSARTLDLKGTATLTGSALQMGNGAIVNLAPSGLFNVKGDGSISYFGGIRPAFNDSGTLEKSAGTGTTTISPDLNISSSGVLFLFKGTLQLVGDTDVLGGGFSVDPGTTLIVNTSATTVAGAAGIDSGGTVRFVAGTTTLNAPFDQTGTTRLEGGTLVNNVPGGLTLPGLTFVNGILSGSSDLTVPGTLDWTDGRMDGPGVTHVPLNATLNLLNNPALSGRTLDLKGTATLTGNSLQMGNGAIVNLAPSGLFNIKGDGSITYFGGTQPAFNDSGTLEKSAGTGASSISPNLNIAASGVLFLFKGTLQLVGDSDVLGGGFSVDPGTTLIVNTSATTVAGAAGIDSGGTVRFVAGTTTLNAPFDQTGTTRLEGGTLVNNVPGGLTLPGLTFVNGILSGTSDLTVPGTLDWTDGRMDGPGVTHVPLNATLNLLNNPALNARTLDLKGTAKLTGNSLQLGNGAAVDNAGTFDISADGSITYFGGTRPTFTNDGLLKKSGGTGISQFVTDLDNFGTVRITRGQLHVQGNYIQHGVGAFEVQLAGNTPDKFGRLVADGAASLLGDFTATLAPGYAPSGGDSFPVLTATSVTGAFFTVNLPVFQGGHLSSQQTPNAFTLTTNGNQAPVAGPDAAATVPGLTVPIDVLLNDIDADGDPITLDSFSQGSGGTVAAAGAPGRLLYTPFVNATFIDTFTYVISDGRGGHATGVVTVNVSAPSGIWTGNGDGHSWSDPNNWNNHVLPGTADDVVIHAAPGVTVVHDSGNDSVHSLTSTSPITLSGGTLSIAADSTVPTFNQTGGTLTGAGTLTITAHFGWDGGTQSGPGKTLVNTPTTGGAQALLTAGTLTDRQMDFAGDTRLSGSAGLTLQGTATLNLTNFFVLADTANIVHSGAPTPVLNLAGEFVKQGGASVLDVNVHVTGELITGSGTLQLNGDIDTVTGPDGLIQLQGGALVVAPSTSLTIDAASSIENLADLTFASGQTTINGAFTASFTDGSNVVHNGTTRLTGGHLTLNHDASLPILQQSGGTLDGTATLTVTSDFAWDGGTQSGQGKTLVSTPTTGGTHALLTAGTLTDRQMDFAGDTRLSGSDGLTLQGTATLNLTNFFVLADTANIVHSGAPTPVLNLAGEFVKQGGTSVLDVNVHVTGELITGSGTLQLNGDIDTVTGPDGLIQLQGGKLIVAPTTSLTVDSSASIENFADLTFASGQTTINGAFTASFTDSGNVVHNGTTSIAGGHVTLNHDASLPILHQSGGTLDGIATLTVTSDFTWDGGTQSGAGKTLVNTPTTGGTHALLTAGTLIDRQMDLAGDTRLFGSAGLTLGGTAVLNLTNFFVLADTAGIFRNGAAAPVLNVAGEFVKQGGTSLLDVNVHVTGELVTGSGTLQIKGDIDTVTGPDGLIQIQGGTLIVAPATSLTIDSSASIENLSQLTFAGGTTTVNGAFTASFTDSGNVVHNGTTQLDGGRLVLNHDASLPIFNQTGGTLDGPATLTVTSQSSWTGGTQKGAGTTRIAAGAALTLGADETLDARTLDVAGSATLATGQLATANGAQIGVASGGTFTLAGDASVTFTGQGARPVFGLDGTLEKTAGSGISEFGPGLFNDGTVRINSGQLNVQGNYSQTQLGTFETRLAGTGAGQFGRVVVAGTADLDGSLHVTLAPGFTPSAGNSFDVLNAASGISGAFAATQLPTFPGGPLVLTQNATSVVLAVSGNRNPTTQPDFVATTTTTPVTINVLGNDSDPDGDVLTIASFTQPAHGAVTLNPDFSLTYTANSGFTGNDAFTYTATDGRGGTAVGNATVQVNPAGGASDPASVSNSLTNGVSSLGPDLGNWGLKFNLNGFETFLPVVGSDLSALFGLGGANGFLSRTALPTFAPATTFQGLKQNLQNAGFLVDFVQGDAGVGANDFVEAHIDRDLTASSGPLAGNRQYDDATAAFLSGILAGLNLDGLLNYSAALHLHLGVGVDAGGFFVTSDSGVRLDVTGGGSVGGATPAGSQQVSATGSADVDFHVSLLGSGPARLHLTDAALTSGNFLALDSNGSAHVSADMHLAPVDLHLAAGWTLTLAHNQTTGVVTASGTLNVPGLQATGSSQPDVIQLSAVFANNVWTIDGSIDAVHQHLLAGFPLASFSAHATLNGTSVSGNFTGQLHTDPEGGAPVVFNVSAGFDNTHFDFAASVTSNEINLGTFAGQSLIWIHTGTLGLNVHSVFGGGGTTTVGVTADADVAVLLPKTAPAGTQPKGIATINGFHGSLDSKGKLQLSANSFAVTATDALVVTGGLIDLTIDPALTAPNTVIASLHDLVVRPAQYAASTQLPTINLAQVRRNGFDVVAHLPLPDATFAGIAATTGASTDLDLHYTTGAPALTGSIVFSANSATLFPGGATTITATGLTGTIDLSTGAALVTAATLDATLGDVLNLHAVTAQLALGADPIVPVFHAAQLTASITGLPGLSVDINDLSLTHAGKFTFASIQAHTTGVLQQFGLAGILPFNVTSVTFTPTVPGDLSQFTIAVVGDFDFTGITLPFTPVVQIGSQPGNGFSFQIRSAELKAGNLVPAGSFGPITLGFSDLRLDPVVLGGTITLGSFVNGTFVPAVAGSVSLAARLPGFDASASVNLTGSRTNLPNNAARYEVLGQLTVSFNVGDGAVVVNNAQLPFDLKITNTPTAAKAVNLVVDTTLTGLNIDSAAITLNDLLSLSATGVHFHFAPAAGQPFLDFDSLTLKFKQGIDFLAGWGGSAHHFGVGLDGSIILEQDPALVVTFPPDSTFGLPSFFPFHATSLGIVFHDGFFAGSGGGANVTFPARVADPSAFGILFSGGLFAAGQFPFNASVQNVELDLQALRQNKFPFTAIAGAGFGLEPVQIGPVTVGGFLNFGKTDLGNFYLDIGGDFGLDGVGEIGGRMIVSQFGPVAGQFTVPLAVPLGPTGLVLTGVTGGLVFGQAPRNVTDASQLTRADIPGLPPGIDAATIASLVDGAVAGNAPLWQRPFTVALSGNIIALEAPGLCNLQVGLALNTGGQFAAFGTFKTLGIPFADALMLLDISRNDPKILARVSSPNAGNPLGFVLPNRTDFQFTFDAQGLTEGLIFGFQTFLQRALAGTQSVANGFVGQVLDVLAADLQAHRTSPLAAKLLAGNPNATINRTFLINRLLALLPGTNLANVEAHLADAGDLVQAVLAQLMDAAASVSFDPASLPASESQAIQDVLNLIGGGAQSLAALVVNLRDAALAGASAFESVFNPFIDIAGALQPVVLGIPFGPPTAGAHLGITKSGIVFGVNLSPSGMLDQFIQGIEVMKEIWNFLKFVDPIPLGLVGSEHLSANVELPFPGSFLTLATGQFPTIDPNSGDWLVSLSGELAPYGMRLASLTGAVFSGGNKAALSLFQVAPNFADTFNPVDPTKIIVSSQSHLDLIRSLGGTILNSQVLLPSLLMDPGNTFAALPPLPSDPLQLPGYIADLATILNSYSQLGRIQIFVPSPETLLKFNFTSFTPDGGSSPRIAPSDTFLAESPDQQKADLQHLIDSIYLEGVLNAKILGIQLAAGTINASATSFDVGGSIPWLLNLQTKFGIAFAPRPIPVTAFVSLFGRQPDASERNPDGTANIQLPVVSATASINTGTDLSTLLSNWGLPGRFFQGILPTGGATFRAYSPAFDPASADPLLRNGGIEFDSDLSLPGLINSASFKFAITPPSGNALLPDFVASAQVSSLTISGLVINNALVQITKAGNNISVLIDGKGSLLGTAVRVHGNLNPDLTGSLSIDALNNALFNVNGFSLSSHMSMTITRQGNRLTGNISFDGTVTLPPWLSAASGQATVNASGSVNSNGNFSLNLSINNFAVGSGTGISIVGASGTGPATFTLNRTAGVTRVNMEGGIKYGAATGLPLMGLSGFLSSAGSGNLNLTFNSSGLNLGGFLVRGGATLAYSPLTFSISVNGQLTVPNLVTNANVTGAITQDGIASLGLSVGTLNLNSLTVRSFTISLNRVGTTGLVYRLHTAATVDITDIITNASVTGDLDSSGFGGLTLSAKSLAIFGFSLTNGSFAVTRAAAGSSFSANASMAFLGQTLVVATPTPLTLGPNGATGKMTLTLNGGAKFSVDGWSLGGTLSLNVTTGGATFSLQNGSLSVPNLFTNLLVNGSLNSAGIGFFTVGTNGNTIHPGGANAPFTITGTFTLSRTQTGGNALVTTFQAANASINWVNVASLNVTSFSLSSNGVLNLQLNPINQNIGGMVLQMGAVSLLADAGGLNLRLHFDGANLTIPGIATGANALTIPAFNVDTTGDFTVTLLDADHLNLGVIDINGKLVFQRVGSVFSLAVQRPNSTTLPSLDVPGFGSVNLNTFKINSDGTFGIGATSTRIGPTALSIRNASISIAKTGAALSTFSLNVNGGQLFLPLGNPIDLPDLVIRSTGQFPNNVTVQVPTLNLGTAFQFNNPNAPASFTLSLNSAGVLHFKLNNAISLTVLSGSSMQLTAFDVKSDGTFTGTVTGTLKAAGYTLASATFNVTLNNGVVRMTLPANKAATFDLGFLKVKFSGFVSSDGHFSLTGSTSISVNAFVGSATGTASFTLSDSGGFSGSFSGAVSAFGFNLASASGTISSSGLLSVDVFGQTATWQL